MKRFALVLFLVAIISAGPALLLAATASRVRTRSQRGPRRRPCRSKCIMAMFLPLPLRHTWPGGYKVIFHELETRSWSTFSDSTDLERSKSFLI